MSSIAIERFAADSVGWRAAMKAAGEKPQCFPHLAASTPSCAPSWSTAALVRVAVSIGVSLVVHVVGLGCLGYVFGTIATVSVLVQPGKASIALRASMAARPSTVAQEPNPVDTLLEITEAIRLRQPEPPLPEPVVAATGAHVRCAELPALVYDAAVDRPIPSLPEPAELEKPSREDTAWVPDRRPDVGLPRTDVGILHLDEVVTSTASLPSPGSKASRGAESSVPTVVSNPAPAYPPGALTKRQTGRVVLRVKLSRDGSVVAAEVYVSSKVASLDTAALEAVRLWKFSPAVSQREALRQVAVPIRFVIDDSKR